MEKGRFVSDKIRGQLAGNDTAEQSFNFSKRPGPLNLQVPVSFIVAVLIQTPSTERRVEESSSLIHLSSVNKIMSRPPDVKLNICHL